MQTHLKNLAMLSVSTLILTACALESSSPNAEALAQTNTVSASAKTTAQKSDTAAKPSLTTNALGKGIYMITGPGGNIGVVTGDDGILVVDDKFERNGQEIISSLNALSDGPIKFVVNTHYHGDHSGANAVMKTTGAMIVAHENVRSRMGKTFENKIFGRTVKAVDQALWPDMTFDSKADFYMNGQSIHLIHMPNAHTDGDTIVYFKEGNILHMGDNYFNGLFPYVDVDSGGTLQGMITAQSKAIELSNEMTQIIPGHGPIATKADLTQTRDMLVDIQTRIETRMASGESLDAMISGNILSDYSAYSSFINEENMIRIAYYSLGGT